MAKKKAKKKAKKLTKAQQRKKVKRIRNKAIRMAMEAVKIRDGFTCQRCGNTKSAGFQIQASHVLPQRMWPDLAADLDNIKCLCGGCHAFWWHMSPAEAGLWFIERWPDRWRRLTKAMEKEKSCSLDLERWQDQINELEEFLRRYKK